MADKVKHPSHYTQGGIECIEAIKASMSHEEYCGYLKGNILKYLWRYSAKNGLEDLEKANVYLGWLIGEQGEKSVVSQIGKSVSDVFKEVKEFYRAETMLCEVCTKYEQPSGKCKLTDEVINYCKFCPDFERDRK